jgi:hypothetical protein
MIVTGTSELTDRPATTPENLTLGGLRNVIVAYEKQKADFLAGAERCRTAVAVIQGLIDATYGTAEPAAILIPENPPVTAVTAAA